MMKAEKNNSMRQLLREFLNFCAREKKWWLFPLIFVIVVLGILVLLATGSGIAWALYPKY